MPSAAPAQSPAPDNPDRGKRTGITSQQWEEITEHVLNGSPISTAAIIADVAPSTVSSLLSRHSRGEVQNGRLVAKLRELKRAQATAEAVANKAVRAGKTGWQGMAWHLERTMPDKYSKRERLDITAVVQQLRDMSDVDLQPLVRQAAIAAGVTELVPGAEFGPAEEGGGDAKH